MSLAKIAQSISPDEFLYDDNQPADDESFEDEVDVQDLRDSSLDDVIMEDEEVIPSLDIVLPEDLEDKQVIILTLPDLPGSELTAEDLAEIVVDEPEEVVVEDKPIDPWDWKHHGLAKFFDWTNERMSGIPRHSGHDVGGIERAIAYLETLNKSIGAAVKTDLKGELDIAKIETIRESIETGIERLEDRLEQLRAGKAKKKKSKKASGQYTGLKKEAGATMVSGIVVTVPLLISKIARVCINGHISAGKDIEDLFRKLSEKYKLSDREKAEVVQLIEDMGYPVFRDSGYFVDEEYDPTSEEGFDTPPAYPA